MYPHQSPRKSQALYVPNFIVIPCSHLGRYIHRTPKGSDIDGFQLCHLFLQHINIGVHGYHINISTTFLLQICPLVVKASILALWPSTLTTNLSSLKFYSSIISLCFFPSLSIRIKVSFMDLSIKVRKEDVAQVLVDLANQAK